MSGEHEYADGNQDVGAASTPPSPYSAAAIPLLSWVMPWRVTAIMNDAASASCANAVPLRMRSGPCGAVCRITATNRQS